MAFCASIVGWVHGANAQTIRVDAAPSHQKNNIVPNKALGAGIDRLPRSAADKLFVQPTIERILAAGWQPVSYRQNTELHVEAWHWNPNGVWSDAAGRGYFTGDSTPGPEPIRHSFGYPLPHRGFTRNEGTETSGYSRLTDGDANTYWKSNPYLTQAFTGESDALHPQWVVVDLASNQEVNAVRIDWAEPYARRYLVQYWTGEDPIKKPTKGTWQTFPSGVVEAGAGGGRSLRLAAAPVTAQFLRIWMTESSNTCDTHGKEDRRNCVGYAIREISIGTQSEDGGFHDLVRHTPDQDQTTTFCSSVDSWHAASDLDEQAGDQVGFDLFFTSGFTRNLPAMIPIAMLYGTPEDSAAEIAYLEKRSYPISYVEMGEEPDGQYMLPEDYAALYVEWAVALHRVDPLLKLGGPVFQGVNQDIEVWPDAQGRVSWTARFLDYLKSHGRLSDLSFFSFEHYPMEPCKIGWSTLYDEAKLVSNIVDVWRQDGVPPNVPLFITESNIAWQSAENSVDIYAALWLGDYIGAFLSAGGSAVYYFHYLPMGLHPGCNQSPGTFAMYTVNREFQILQPTSQYFASQLINLEWVEPGDQPHGVFSAVSDVSDGAGHALVTAYALLRPDHQWSLLVINKDQENAHGVRIIFADGSADGESSFTGKVTAITFGSEQYQWHPERGGGTADPDGPAAVSSISAQRNTVFTLPKSSMTVLRGTVARASARGKSNPDGN